MAKRLNSFKILFITFVCITGCHRSQPSATLGPDEVGRVVEQMTHIMVHDVTNPPLAARFFAYSCLAGYEVVTENDSTATPWQRRLNNYPDFKAPASKPYDNRLSALLAIMETAAKLQPSGALMTQYKDRFLDSCKRLGFEQATIDSSEKYALAVSKKILAYAKADRYRNISNYKRYTTVDTPGAWYPTPPAYLPAVEPYFRTVRPFTLDSSSQFMPAPAAKFSTNKKSPFYKLMLVTADQEVSKLSPEKREIAGFWDCNPFAVQDNGHMLIGLKKISPGAHWMGIAAIACNKTKTGFSKTVEINTAVAIGLMDSFLACWDEKYGSNRIRPETAIHQLLDPNWKGLLQTPPFPEYLSGHSCVSATSAVILSHYFGDNFEYTDNVEERYGLKPRHFNSFEAASEEAGISRLYGGIHFKDAIDNGQIQGKKVGNWVLGKITGTKVLQK